MAIIDDLKARLAAAVTDGDAETVEALTGAIERLESGQSKLREQVPGRMGLGTSQERYVSEGSRGLPRKPSPMTANHRPGGGRS